MKIIQRLSFTYMQRFLYLCVMVLFWASTWAPVSALSNTASFTVSPQSGTYTVGQEFSVSVVVSLDNYYNAASADVYFNSGRYQYLGTTPGTAFNGSGSATVGANGFGSYVSIDDNRVSGGSLYGSYVLATLRFRATSAGGAYLNFGSRRAVLYPTTEYTTTATNGTYSVQAAPTPAPTPTPTPSPTPAPTPTPTPSPTPRKPAPVAKAPSQSTQSKTGLQITDFSISNLSYATATLTWKTNKPATTKVNFSTTKSDLYIERGNENLTTDHVIELDSDTLEAGQHYYARITSSDGSGPVTIDGEFDTKYIPVTIKITGEGDKPVADATITIDEAIGITDESGEATFDLSNGEVYIYASKDGQETDTSADVEIPESDDSPVQKITLSLISGTGSTSKDTPAQSSPSSTWRLILAFFILALGGGAIAFVFLRRRIAGSTNDPLEAGNYTPAPTPPSLPAQQPVIHQKQDAEEPGLVTPPEQHTAHHASIAELVASKAVGQSSATPPEVPQSTPSQQAPQHTSLKDMVKIPTTQKSEDSIEIPGDDLPIAPESTTDSHSKASSGTDEDSDQLTIHH